MIPTTIKVSIVLFKIVEIDEANHAVDFQYEIVMRWRENRLTYQNLKEDTSLNALSEVDMRKLWLPLVIFANTDQKLTTRLGMEWEWNTIVTVTREGDFARSGLDSLHEVEIFKGDENTLSMRQTYTNKFQCQFVLNRYPFDTQVGAKKVNRHRQKLADPFWSQYLTTYYCPQKCTIDMLVGTLDLKTVTLHPDKLWLEQEKDMTLFQITNHRLIFTNSSNPKQGMRMIVVMKRKIMSEIMTTYFPSILLTLITFATTFFKRIYFEASLSVNLTTMLVMTTIFISKMEGLPPTSEIKMIDLWLVLCQLVPFIEVILVTAIEFHNVERVEIQDNDNEVINTPSASVILNNDKNERVDNKVFANNFVEARPTKRNDRDIIVPLLSFIGENDYQDELPFQLSLQF